MSYIFLSKFLFLISYLIIHSNTKEMLSLPLNEIKRGSLQSNEYDYYTLVLPKEIDKDNHLIVKLEANKNLDVVNNILSDPNLYISMDDKRPNHIVNTWR